MVDTDLDGTISVDEALAAGFTADDHAGADADGDGFVTADEIDAEISG